MNNENIKNQVIKNKKSERVNTENEKKKIWYFTKALWKNKKDIML